MIPALKTAALGVLEHGHTGAMTRRSAVPEATDPEPGLYVAEDDLCRFGLAIGDPVPRRPPTC